MSAWRLALRIAALALHIVLGMILTPLFTARASDGERRTSPAVTSWWHNRLADILGLGITVTGPRPVAPVLFAANHVSWLDIIVLGGLTPTVFLSKAEVRKWPVVGWLAARAGTLFIRRGDGEAGTITAQIARKLEGGAMLTLFAEGTTTDGRQVRPFFPRLFAAAVETVTPVVPVTLRYHVNGDFDAVAPYVDEQTLADNLRGLLRRPRTQVHVRFAGPIDPSQLDRKAVARQAHAQVAAALADPGPIPISWHPRVRKLTSTDA